MAPKLASQKPHANQRARPCALLRIAHQHKHQPPGHDFTCTYADQPHHCAHRGLERRLESKAPRIAPRPVARATRLQSHARPFPRSRRPAHAHQRVHALGPSPNRFEQAAPATTNHAAPFALPTNRYRAEARSSIGGLLDQNQRSLLPRQQCTRHHHHFLTRGSAPRPHTLSSTHKHPAQPTHFLFTTPHPTHKPTYNPTPFRTATCAQQRGPAPAAGRPAQPVWMRNWAGPGRAGPGRQATSRRAPRTSLPPHTLRPIPPLHTLPHTLARSSTYLTPLTDDATPSIDHAPTPPRHPILMCITLCMLPDSPPTLSLCTQHHASTATTAAAATAAADDADDDDDGDGDGDAASSSAAPPPPATAPTPPP